MARVVARDAIKWSMLGNEIGNRKTEISSGLTVSKLDRDLRQSKKTLLIIFSFMALSK